MAVPSHFDKFSSSVAASSVGYCVSESRNIAVGIATCSQTASLLPMHTGPRPLAQVARAAITRSARATYCPLHRSRQRSACAQESGVPAGAAPAGLAAMAAFAEPWAPPATQAPNADPSGEPRRRLVVTQRRTAQSTSQLRPSLRNPKAAHFRFAMSAQLPSQAQRGSYKIECD